jgi:hypothetical protein
MDQLAGKKVLFWSPAFFGYEREIKLELEDMGARVTWIEDRPFSSSLMKAMTKQAPRLVQRLCDSHYEKQLTQQDARQFDIMLVINGQTLSRVQLARLRAENPAAQFVLYMWDSMQNRQSVAACLDLYDSAYSFDPASARQYGMRLRPLFFTRGFEAQTQTDMIYDVSFIGTAHTDRYGIVKNIEAALSDSQTHYWYFYLQAPWVFQLYRLRNPDFKHAQQNEFRFSPLQKAETQRVFQASGAVIDIEHPLQGGLTMRTFEALGAQKKLITTNANVRDYDFFHSQNIHVIDRTNPVVPRSFYEGSFKPLPASIRTRYSCKGWVREVLGLHNSP